MPTNPKIPSTTAMTSNTKDHFNMSVTFLFQIFKNRKRHDSIKADAETNSLRAFAANFLPDEIQKSKEVLNILGIILIIEGIRHAFGFRFRCLVDSN